MKWQVSPTPRTLNSIWMVKKDLYYAIDFYDLLRRARSNLDVGGQGLGAKYMHHDVLRPAKVNTMLAMRACRKSIMIGKPLSREEMKKVVVNLSSLEAPWNCPHG